jgi:hypothetical protein
MTVALLVTSNGAGMGHLSRQLSLALSARPGDTSALFSLSLGLPQVLGMGIPGEYCPSYERDVMPRYFWNRYLRTRLVAICEEIGAEVVVFDGVAPYRGLLATRQHLPEVGFVWLRRGMWIEGKGEAFLRKSVYFDAVIEPGDLGAVEDRGATNGRTDSIRIPPVSMLDVVPRVDRREAAAFLGLDPDRPTALVTLGTGRLGDAASPGRVALETLLADESWQVALTTAAIARSGIPIPDPSRVVEIRGVYPLVRYLNAFDASVSAAGYNAVHELVSGGVPTLLVANSATRTDDQVARARGVAGRGLALTADEGDSEGLAHEVRRLLDAAVRAELTGAISSLGADEVRGGGAAGWDVVAGVAETHRATLGARARALRSVVDDGVRSAVMATIGKRGTDAVRRMARRTVPGGVPAPLPVAVVDRFDAAAPGGPTPLLFSERLSVDDVRTDHPIEHLMAGTSEEYRSRRLGIIRRNYQVIDERI